MELKKFFYSEKGVRPTNEDAEVLYDTENIKIFGIFDGHGSDEVSKLLKKNIVGILTNKEIKYPISKKQIEVICANIQSYIKKKPYANSAGSTANIVIIYNCNNQYYFTNINVGDSRCVIYMNDKIIQVSEDHKPTNINEYNRIIQMGGKVYRDGLEYRVGDLSVSRSFGDCSNKYTFPVPDIKTFKFNSNLNFIIGCDGLFDVMKNEDICYEVNNYIKTNGKMNIARKLTSLAYNTGSTDNISVIVGIIEFNGKETDKKEVEKNVDKKVNKNVEKNVNKNVDKKEVNKSVEKKEVNKSVEKKTDKKDLNQQRSIEKKTEKKDLNQQRSIEKKTDKKDLNQQRSIEKKTEKKDMNQQKSIDKKTDKKEVNKSVDKTNIKKTEIKDFKKSKMISGTRNDPTMSSFF